MAAILPSKKDVSQRRSDDARVKTKEHNVPEAKLAVAKLGEDLSRERNFSAAYVGDRDH